MTAKEPKLALLQSEIGYDFSDPTLLMRCLTHVSYSRGEAGSHNETLEFLGDAVLNLAISDLLMRRFPDKSEGELSKMRASLVNAAALEKKAQELKLGELLRMGKGEERSGGRKKRSILAGAFEALLGGVYWEGGYEAARRIVERYFSLDINERKLGQQDYKTRLQEISQMLFHTPPAYTLIEAAGPDHAKHFVTQIAVGGEILGRGDGGSKKESEQQAAKKALQELQRGGCASTRI